MVITIDDLGPALKGFVKVRLPKNGERISLIDDHGIDLFEMQSLGTKSVADQNRYAQKVISKVMDHVGEYCEEIKLEDLNGNKVTDFETIASDFRFLMAQMNIAQTVLFGADQLATKKKPKSKKPSPKSSTVSQTPATHGTNTSENGLTAHG